MTYQSKKFYLGPLAGPEVSQSNIRSEKSRFATATVRKK